MEEKELPKEQENLSIIDEAKKAVEELRKENDRKEELLKKEQELKVNDMLGGQTTSKPQEQPKKLTPQEYADAVMRGEIGDAKA